MRTLIALLVALCAAPAFAQTPPPETITFEGLGTPIPYEPDAKVPVSARLKRVELAGGGIVRFRTRGAAKYVALVTHFGTTGIAPVTKKGRILDPNRRGRFIDMRLRKAPDARLDSFVPIQAGVRVDTKGTTDTADDETFYDADAGGVFFMFPTDARGFPAGGGQLQLVRSGADPLNLVKDPYDLTTTQLDFERLLIFGELVYDDLVVSFGH